jgi:prolyl-tRNA synthetase
MPPIVGRKTDSERFAGAVRTYCVEALMQDNKALQAGTSHMLGQNFSKQFDLKFQTEAGEEDYAYNTSWGVSTRMVGGLVMTHGDDNGIVVPPWLAPTQVVIVPIYRTDEERALVLGKANEVSKTLRGAKVRTHIDSRDTMKPGAKYYEWERKGVPMRVEVGPKDVANNKLVIVMRTEVGGIPRKEIMEEAAALTAIPERLEHYQNALRIAAVARREANTHRGIAEYDKLKELVEADAGFVFAGWCGSAECEAKVKEETKATIRCLPFEEFRSKQAPESCVVCGASAAHEAVWARAY